MSEWSSVTARAAMCAVAVCLACSASAQQSPPGTPGQPALRLVDVSADILVAGGASTEDRAGVESLQGGGHDPKREGFTLQGAEISLSGAVDPYFDGELHLVATEDEIELEEAFATTRGLAYGLQLEAGYFLTEFGRLNPTHPHQWRFIDAPVINTRIFGADGTRGAGARVGWIAPLPWYSQLHVGLQNADNESMVSFLGEGHVHGGEDAHAEEEHEHAYEETVAGWPRTVGESDDLLYLLRWENAGDLTDTVSALIGVSGLAGPNATGEGAETFVYGADMTLKWRPARQHRGYPFVEWTTEFIRRDFEAAAYEHVHEDGDVVAFGAETLEDWGLYSQLVWGFAPGWEAGLRAEYATGSDNGVEPREEDPARDDRIRIAPMLAWRPTEFSRIRAQYNYDEADHLEDGAAHSVWLGLEILYGSHPAHRY